jgi:GTP cyclohydrolase I
MASNTVPSLLPDVAGDAVALARPLDWVGMEHMALPLRFASDADEAMSLAADVDVAVDLHDADARGIHMSRLYLQVQERLAGEVLRAAGLRRLLPELVASQRGLATAARLVLRFPLLLSRPALESGHRGWKQYPVALHAQWRDAHFALAVQVSVEYSSTCPASAALSRQLNAGRFAEDFAGQDLVQREAITSWLASPRGLAATPHAQRSRAEVRAWLRPSLDELPIAALIDGIEAALGTPVQTAVKREDEQAFARANAENLMFCEDAARRVAAVLASDVRIERFELAVAHFESLHPHDAVARVSGRGGSRD